MLGKKPPKKRKIKKQYDGYLFSFPIVFLLGALIVYPMLYGFYISFFNTNLVSKWKFVGLKYYLAAFTEPEFYQSVFLTLKFMVLVVAGHFILGFILASLFSKLHLDRILCRRLYHRPCKSDFSGRYGDIYGYHERYIRFFKDSFRNFSRAYGSTGSLAGYHENRRKQWID